ncbi:putative hydrolase of the HAD superfamily [Clostridium cavendishii DSM 21758]|uniref:Putative hydrolase of the HAD superfamily n=1 Tax=Clostridium cavendishii DSM 21758 TaxID=1121302 RepID=A0A1M6B188_9CLOT|nr:HAD-IA family hydrolase [Clostridium cavendishii]SHI42243.1 putative hydrolase of the HAD superfamily [Clostridium cavendishii DSM 21758]
MIKTLIFDLDDTLYNERTYVFGAFKEVCDYLGNKHDLNAELLYKDVINIFYEKGRGKIFNDLCDKHNLKENIKNLVSTYRKSRPKLTMYEDALYMLKWLKKHGYNLGVITDGKSIVQWNKIKSLNLEEFVDKIVVSDDLGSEFWKPHEKPYLEVINYFNCKNEECIYVGDNPNKDFVGARKLNLKTIRIIREEGDHMKTFLSKEYEADFNIDSLTEIKEVLKDIN